MNDVDQQEIRENGLIYKIGDGERSSVKEDYEIIVLPFTSISFDINAGGSWYGHGFSHRQPYPLNSEPIINHQFKVNNIQSPIWMCSHGFVILADTTSEISVSMNENNNGLLVIVSTDQPVTIKVFFGRGLPDAHHKLRDYLGFPRELPDQSFIGDVIFCTWTQYPRCISQERIISMAKEIRRQEYPCTVMTIDDIWESEYGELQFSQDFPQPVEMVKILHNLQFKVLLWVTPFVNQEASTFEYLSKSRYLVKRKNEDSSALFKWWGGTAGLIDLTNPAARNWYKEQLLCLRNRIGIDGFKIDGGDAKYQPSILDAEWCNELGPSAYIDELLKLFEEITPGMCESRTAWLSSSRNIVWREGGKDSHWGIDNGLTAMVNLGLNMSLIGYDLFMPDMIPGRVQTMVENMPLPTDELFVRWAEVSAFMPVMQFSYFPWNYCENTAKVIKEYAIVHKVLQEYIYQQLQNRENPLIQPMWYQYPDINQFYTIADQFFLGSDLLIAPVLSESQKSRNIVFPPGKWRDVWTGEVFVEGKVLNYPTPCPGIPVFVKLEKEELFNKLFAQFSKITTGTISSGITTSTYCAGVNRDLSVTG